MASCHWRYHVFPSFSGKDVRRTFLSHIHKEFQRKGIKMFEDEKIQRGQTIGPELVQAIRQSMISIILFSKNYASSSWCLNELLEIMNCRDTTRQKVMTIFYGVDPCDVRKQSGDFGKAFKKTCVGKTKELKQKWKQALADAANIVGYHFGDRDKEADMIEKITRDLSKVLNYSMRSRDFDSLVGIETHMAKLNSLLCLESNEVRMVGIWGPAGIGKTTIARALYSRISRNFQLHLFMENIGGRFRRTELQLGDDYGFKLYLQEQFLCQIFEEVQLKLPHLGLVRERLKHQKVLLVLDGVDKAEQLEALADDTEWFGRGSRIIVTTEDKNVLNGHGIEYIYKMDLPSNDEALQIFCQSAFRKNSSPDGFKDLASEIVHLIGHLPLGLKVIGSYLRGMSKEDWNLALPRLETSLNGEIERVLKFGYDSLEENDRAIFRHIACLFNGMGVEDVRQLLADSGLGVDFGLKVLASRCLIHILENRWIEMHNLLMQVGRNIVRRRSEEPGRREFLVDTRDIYDVLTENSGTESVLGICLDLSKWDEWFINNRALEGMPNLRYLIVYPGSFGGRHKLYLSEESSAYLPRKLRLFEWGFYARKSLPQAFHTRFLVELSMPGSELEKLWDGIKPLGRLKRLDLSYSSRLKEIPDLSTATNLERLNLRDCPSLVALHPSIRYLKKLTHLDMSLCTNFESFPTDTNLESLEKLNLYECSRLRCCPEIYQKY